MMVSDKREVASRLRAQAEILEQKASLEHRAGNVPAADALRRKAKLLRQGAMDLEAAARNVGGGTSNVRG
jgi:predicted metal-dependent hydrolase